MPLNNLIDIDGLTFSFGKRRVFQDFVFRSESPVTLLRGPSGCGKTTLLKLIHGLLIPTYSRLLERPDRPFLVLQTDALVPWFSGKDNIERFSKTVWKNVQISPLFELISNYIDQRASEMSYGQRRTIELVRALCANPGVLLLDEPFNFLDSERRSFLISYINRRQAENGFSRIVLTTHYVEDIPIESADTFEFCGEMPHRQLTKSLGANDK